MFHTDDSMKIDDINKEAKRHMVYIWPEKVYFLIPTPEKVGTSWDLNPHSSGGRRCNHITRISA